MTVTYQYQVANSTSGGFTRLLFLWRGSLYKLIYKELLIFLLIFATLSAIYRHLLNAAQKKDFEQIVIYCDKFINLIPLSFVLGFYVSYVAQRWWQQYQAIPWPDKVMHSIALHVTGNDDYARMLRRALMRYLNLSLTLVLRSISSAVKKRFPTLEHVVDSGFMTSLELELFIAVPSVEFNTYWIPCTWFINLLKEARENQRIPDPQGLKLIMEEFNEFRTKCGLLWSYDWISIPLVYTQVVTLATYSFFGVALIGRQYIEGKEKQFQLQVDIYIPIFTILQFFFFMGLLKVAEQLINPFGDDDEDFELNWIIDRHTKVSYLGVDILMNRCPPLVKDIYYDAENLILPYTEAAAAYKKKTYRGSVAHMTVPEEKQTMFLPDVIEEDEEGTVQSLHMSNMSLATHANNSPICERRQINLHPETPTKTNQGCPETPTKTNQGCPETVLQFDIQESSSRVDQMEQRPKVFSETVVYAGDINPWKEYSRVPNLPMFEVVTPDQSPEAEKQCDPKKFFDNFKVSTEDSPHATRSESLYHSVSHLQLPDTNVPAIAETALKTKSPRYVIRRHKSMEAPKKLRIQWTQMMRTQRKKITDDIPPVEVIMLETKSSPNLNQLAGNLKDSTKDTDDEMNSS